MRAFKVRILLFFFSVLLSFALLGCATPSAKSPESKSAFVKGVRSTVDEIVATARIATCEVMSDDCPDSAMDRQPFAQSSEGRLIANSGQ